MKLIRVALTPYRLPLLAPVDTAQGRLVERRGWLLELEADGGGVGRGDACPFPGGSGGGDFAMESWSACGEHLEALARGLLGRDLGEREGLLRECEAQAPGAPGARFAVDCALAELGALSSSLPVAAWLAQVRGAEARPELPVSALVPGASADEVGDQARSLAADGFETFKLKLGARDAASDLQRARALRGALGPGPRIRLDANGAWTREEAERRLPELAPLDIEFIEQPVAAHDVEGLAQMRAGGWMKIAADESLVVPARADAVMDCQAADVLVLKPAALGGLGRALGLAERARGLGVECCVTSLMDSAFGLTAAIHLAASLPGEGPAHGLATGSLFEFDLAAPPRIEKGRLSVPSLPGWGLCPEPGDAARAALGEPQVWKA